MPTHEDWIKGERILYKSPHQNAYESILRVFGLDSQDVSIENVVSMSPQELARISGKDTVRDTTGDYRKASEVGN
ncbi:hypothetical protein FJZ19_03695 [Candidatus Pacearchaeota archaeon]|nr:hypothetical protein [Candidatus Pacearchaeota archaeon]